MYNVIERRIKIGEYEVNYASCGDGEPLILIHGSRKGDSWNSWTKLLPLAKRYRLIMPDLIGYGKSSKTIETPDYRLQASIIKGIIDELSIYEVSLIGVAWGGQIALECLIRWPELVKCLVLIASTYDKAQIPKVRGIKKPTLIIWAEDDMVTQLKGGYILRDSIKTSRLEILRVSKDPRYDFTQSHMIERFRGDEIIEILDRFIGAPEQMIIEPTEMEDELKGMLLRMKDEESP